MQPQPGELGHQVELARAGEAQLHRLAADAVGADPQAALPQALGGAVVALGVEDDLATMPYMTEAMLVTLGKAGIKTLDDLADLATDELVEKKRQEPRRRNEDAPKRPEPKGGILAEYGLSDEQGNEIIMAARQHWFADEDGGDADAATDTVDAEGEQA